MVDKSKPTLLDYLKNVKGLGTLLAGLVPLLPSAVSSPGYWFPPLGDVTPIGRTGVLGLSLALIFISFWLAKPQKVTRRFIILFVAGVVFFVFYFFSARHFVKRIDRPADNSTTYVSVGYERTQFAQQTFGSSESDEEMLRNRGLTDEDISRLWTDHSIDMARLCLLISYLGFVLSLVLIACIGARDIVFDKLLAAE